MELIPIRWLQISREKRKKKKKGGGAGFQERLHYFLINPKTGLFDTRAEMKGLIKRP